MNPRITPNALRLACAGLALALAPAAGVRGQEQSVAPGINAEYADPDVAEFVRCFERPGREIYDRRHDLVAACGLRPGMAVADVGAGTGLFTRLFARAVGPRGRVYAVDISAPFVDHVMETCAAAGLGNVTGVVCPADSVALPPGSIDLAFVCDTYHHFEYPARTLASIRQALRPGGRLVVIDFVREEGVSEPWVLHHVRAGQAQVVREVEEAGFRLAGEKALLREFYFLSFVKAGDDGPQRRRHLPGGRVLRLLAGRR